MNYSLKIKYSSSSLFTFLLFSAAFLVFLCFRAPSIRNAPYYLDDYYNFQEIQKVFTRPLAPLVERNNKEPRRNPLFTYLFFLEYRAFGIEISGYYLVLFLIHFMNSLLISRLAIRAGGDLAAATIAGIFFLCSSAFYPVLISLSSTPYAVCLFFFLLACLSWVSFVQSLKKIDFLKTAVFLTLALLTIEAAFVFPILAIFLVWYLNPGAEMRRAPIRTVLLYAALLFFVSGIVSLYLLQDFFQAPAGDRIQWLSGAGLLNFVPKLTSLLKMLFQPLFIPDRGRLPLPGIWEHFGRVAPLFFLFTISVILLPRAKGASLLAIFKTPLVLMGFAWTFVTVLPYLACRITFEHAPRYLYFPMAGFSVVFGVCFARFFSVLRASYSWKGILWGGVMLAYILFLNLSSTSYHYDRYEKYLSEHPQQEYHQKIADLFSPS